MPNPARRAKIAEESRRCRAETRRLNRLQFTLRLRSLGFRLEMLRLRALITILKLPDYLSAPSR